MFTDWVEQEPVTLVYRETIKELCDSAGFPINPISLVQIFIDKYSKEKSLILHGSEKLC